MLSVRSLWTFGRPPTFVQRAVGNWNHLEECESCGALWVSVPHEPYASFRFWTLWPSSAEVWRRLNDRDQALIIHEWHDAVLRETWSELPAAEREHVEAWRERTYRRFNPIDRERAAGAQGPHFVQKASDLARYVREVAG
jgi:hypothetical protein